VSLPGVFESDVISPRFRTHQHHQSWRTTLADTPAAIQL